MGENICEYFRNDSSGLGRCIFKLPALPIWVVDPLKLPLVRKNPNCENCNCFTGEIE